MKEIFRPVVGYEGRYEVSNLGNIKRVSRFVYRPTDKHNTYELVAEILMSPKTSKTGYKVVKLVDDRGNRRDWLVHRLVAFAFIDKPSDKDYVNHKNGIKDDNRAENLEWCSIRENNIHAYKTGLKRRFHAGQFVKGVPVRLQKYIRSTNETQ